VGEGDTVLSRETLIDPATVIKKETKTVKVESSRYTKSDPTYDMSESELEEAEDNTNLFSKWFSEYDTKCSASQGTDDMVSFAKTLKDGDESSAESARGVKRCKNVFLDFGSNIGDSMGKFIDANLLGCEKNNEGVRYDVTDRDFVVGKYNKISTSFSNAAKVNGLAPNHFCLYGVEGNPAFTDRLKKMEDDIMSMSPRPVKNIHMLTEHVGMGVDGPTKLYLDTVNVKENFWGSSVLQSHQDVQKSAAENKGDGVTAADVEGITLTTLMDKGLLAFSPNATPEDKEGGTLIVKIDIEGGEYDLMSEVAESLKLCEYKAMGNEVILIVEYHFMSITDVKERRPRLQKKDAVKAKLADCGVEMTGMSAMWN